MDDTRLLAQHKVILGPMLPCGSVNRLSQVKVLDPCNVFEDFFDLVELVDAVCENASGFSLAQDGQDRSRTKSCRRWSWSKSNCLIATA